MVSYMDAHANRIRGNMETIATSTRLECTMKLIDGRYRPFQKPEPKVLHEEASAQVQREETTPTQDSYSGGL